MSEVKKIAYPTGLTSNVIDSLTAKQRDQLNEFKKKVSDIEKPFDDDDYHVRWLIARDWDMKKAEKMIRDSMEWRKKFGIDKLLDWEPPEVTKYIPGGYYGYTKEHYPVWYELPGKIDLYGFMHSVSKREAGRSRLRHIEYLFNVVFPEQSKKTGKLIRECALIVDLDGLGMKHFYKPAVDMITELITLVELNYPETLRLAYVINGGRIVPLAWSVVKPFLAPNTRNKVKILGKNWKEELQTYIPADQIPVHWGGTAKDPDGDLYCKSKIRMGGEIPEHYRTSAHTSENIDVSQFSSITVNKGATMKLEYRVDKPGSALRWNFSTEGKDIKFGVYLNEDGSSSKSLEDMKEVVPSVRVNSHMVPEAGTLECEKTGTYVIHFDNSYSWVTSKKVSYLIEVVVPETEDELKKVQITNL